MVTLNSLTVEISGGGSATNTLSLSASTLKNTSEISANSARNLRSEWAAPFSSARGLTIGEHSGATRTYTFSGTGSLSSDTEGEWFRVSGTID